MLCTHSSPAGQLLPVLLVRPLPSSTSRLLVQCPGLSLSALTFSCLHFPPRPANPPVQQFYSTLANILNSLAPSAFLFPLSGKNLSPDEPNYLHPAPSSCILPKKAKQWSRSALLSMQIHRWILLLHFSHSPSFHRNLWTGFSPPLLTAALNPHTRTHTQTHTFASLSISAEDLAGCNRTKLRL